MILAFDSVVLNWNLLLCDDHLLDMIMNYDFYLRDLIVDNVDELGYDGSYYNYNYSYISCMQQL